MTSRFRLALIVGSLALPLTLAGCADSFNAGPLSYVESERLTQDLAKSPKLQAKVRDGLAKLFGEDPQHIRVPEGAGLTGGGIYLGNYRREDVKGGPVDRPIYIGHAAGTGEMETDYRQRGGYSLYREHCLHCHGVSGAGDGPTAPFLFPRPRDYRKGLFKFTSTPTGAKPTREDLRKTVRYGLHGTSMPAFEALMSGPEMEMVIDYLVFLSMRGETELGLIEEAMIADEADPQALGEEVVADISKSVFGKWKAAEGQVLNPPVPRTPPTRESILRGKELFLGLNKTGNKVDCTSCHGPKAVGDGPSFVKQDVYNSVVFNGHIPRRFELSSGELEILQALTDLEAGSKAGEHGKGEPEKSEGPKSPTLANLVEAVKRDMQVSDKDDVATLKSKLGYKDEPGTEVSSLEDIVDAQLADLEAKTLVSRGFGFSRYRLHAEIDGKAGKLWNDSLDDWRNPVRPANLNRGVYKGGRRPIDLYWRIAKGINGAKMPAHFPTIEPERIWDLVNFVLELPFEPTLLQGATLPSSAPVPTPNATPKVAVRH